MTGGLTWRERTDRSGVVGHLGLIGPLSGTERDGVNAHLPPTGPLFEDRSTQGGGSPTPERSDLEDKVGGDGRATEASEGGTEPKTARAG